MADLRLRWGKAGLKGLVFSSFMFHSKDICAFLGPMNECKQKLARLHGLSLN